MLHSGVGPFSFFFWMNLSISALRDALGASLLMFSLDLAGLVASFLICGGARVNATPRLLYALDADVHLTGCPSKTPQARGTCRCPFGVGLDACSKLNETPHHTHTHTQIRIMAA